MDLQGKDAESADSSAHKEVADVDKASLLLMCERVNTPFALKLWKLYEAGKPFEVSIDPRNYTEQQIDEFRKDYLVYNYLRKNPVISITDTKAAATASFYTAEVACKATNLSFYTGNPQLLHLVSKMQSVVLRLIGREPGDITPHCGWGPGATYDLKGLVTVAEKLGDSKTPLTTTVFNRPLARAQLGADIHWLKARGIDASADTSPLNCEFAIVPGNRFTTVEKDAKTDRGICVEPTMNVFVQKGFGRILRRRLKANGIDLNDQTINQTYAQKAYRFGYSTIDLSQASDTVSYELVKHVLPNSWFDALSACRSGCTEIDGGWHVNEKFSSMGNGYTFELETLLFYALCESVGCTTISVYGDDLIIDREHYGDVVDALKLIGFIPNESKSFRDGLFYESCGKHYFCGVDVTPIFQKERYDGTDQASIARRCNRLYRYCHVNYMVGPDHPDSPAYLRRTWTYLIRSYKGEPRGPLCDGDPWLFSSKFRMKGANQIGVKMVCWTVRGERRYNAAAALAYWLRFGSEEPMDESFSIRGSSRSVSTYLRIPWSKILK